MDNFRVRVLGNYYSLEALSGENIEYEYDEIVCLHKDEQIVNRDLLELIASKLNSLYGENREEDYNDGRDCGYGEGYDDGYEVWYEEGYDEERLKYEEL